MKQGWEIKTIADVCTFIKNGANIKQERGAGGVPITRIETLSGGVFNRDRLGYANLETPDKYLSYVLEYGDLLFSHINSKTYIGRTVVYVPENDEQIIHGMNLLRLKLDFDLISPFFFQYYTRTDKFKAQVANRRKDAVNQSSITTTDIKTISLPVPPIAEQEKIVAELDCLSGIIEKKKQQLKELDNLAQSIFYEMFGDPVENDKGWDIVTLDDVFEIGSSKRVFESQWTDSGVPFYRAREIVKLSKGENIDSPIFISEELYHEYSRKYGVPAEGDMMVTAVGTLGVCYLVKNTDRFYFKDGNTLWFKSRGLCETRFIKDEFATDFIVNQIKGNANAAVVGTYTITNAKKTRVILPPLSLQQEYVRKVQHIDKQKELIARSIKETETLFNSRMDYYFN